MKILNHFFFTNVIRFLSFIILCLTARELYIKALSWRHFKSYCVLSDITFAGDFGAEAPVFESGIYLFKVKNGINCKTCENSS